jgi:glycosyltransferase involved in cell wall biosynthesis
VAARDDTRSCLRIQLGLSGTLRVLTITLTYPLFPGDGTAPFVDSITRALVRRGHKIDVVLPHHPQFRHLSDDSLRFVPCRYSPLEQWAPWGFGNTLRGDSSIRLGAVAALPAVALAMRRRISQLLSRGTYDIVHAHWIIPNGWLAAAPVRRRRVPFVVSVHGSDISLAERNPLLSRAARTAFGAARAVSAPSDHLRKRAERVGADPSTTTTVRWGVDIEAFATAAGDPVLRRRLLGDGTDSDVLFVGVGRLIECKGFEYLIDAAARVPGIRVAIIGDGDLRSSLESRARALGAPVEFVGAMPQQTIPDALAAADGVVVPLVADRSGRIDGFPMTVLEGLASGRPLVATRFGGVPEIVSDGRNGLLFEQKDPAALAVALDRLRADPEERRRLGARGRESVAGYTWDHSAAAIEAMYERALAS